MRKLTFLAVLSLGIFAGQGADAGGDPDYVLSFDSAAGSVGGSADVTIFLDNTGSDLQGWQWGVCDDALVSTTEDDVANGAAVAATSFTFHAINEATGGWTVGCLTNVVTGDVLEPGEDLEMYITTYSLDEVGTATVEFCETLGDPVVLVRVVVASTEIEPTIEAGTIEITKGPPPFLFTAESVSADYDPTTGEGAFSVLLGILEDDSNPGFPNSTQGFSMGLAHDGALLLPVDFDPVGDLATVFNGGPPNFFGASLAPSMGADDGVTVGVVYNLMGGTFLTFDDGDADCEVDYETVPDAFVGDMDGVTTSVTWDDTLGTPDVLNTVVVDGESAGVGFADGIVTLEAFVPPETLPFVRGDANDDGFNDIADGIWILNDLFQDGPATGCFNAGDANDDDLFNQADAVFIFNYQFLNGAAPPAPFPACGEESEQTIEDCESQDSCL